MIKGIYKITNKINNKSYIGISTDVFGRLKGHFEYPNDKMKKDLKKYGVEGFTFEILDTPNENNDLIHSEAYYISTFNSIKYGYNTEKGSIYMHYDPVQNRFYI